jgi:hypothetical protein
MTFRSDFQITGNLPDDCSPRFDERPACAAPGPRRVAVESAGLERQHADRNRHRSRFRGRSLESYQRSLERNHRPNLYRALPKKIAALT